LRRVLAVNAELARRLDEVEKHLGRNHANHHSARCLSAARPACFVVERFRLHNSVPTGGRRRAAAMARAMSDPPYICPPTAFFRADSSKNLKKGAQKNPRLPPGADSCSSFFAPSSSLSALVHHLRIGDADHPAANPRASVARRLRL
jgi:hypothetical protein